MKQLTGKKLIKRYKKYCNISDSCPVTEDMVLKHCNLEKELRQELLNSNKENRWGVFEKSYTKLYTNIYWLNSGKKKLNPLSFKAWSYIIGNAPKKIFEIGPGKGELLTYLSNLGHICKGTEITTERGKKHNQNNLNLEWGASDGIHLSNFEPHNYYNFIISDQVVEHIHEDDIVEHFSGALSILDNGGKYLFRTPHVFFGPHDVSNVLNENRCNGVHLKEYTYKELIKILSQAGYSNIYAVFKIPQPIEDILYTYNNFLFKLYKPRLSKIYLNYLCIIEQMIGLLPTQTARRMLSKICITIFFNSNIFLAAEK